jgi:hypothetical protein
VAFTKGHTTDFYDNEVFVDGQVQRIRDRHIVEYFSDRAVDFLRARDRSRPFFLQVNYDGPYVLPPTVVGADRRNPFFERFEHRTFRPFPPLDDRLIRSVVVPFDFDLDPAEEYTLASAFNNLWWTVRVHNDQMTRANIAAQNALDDRVRAFFAAHADPRYDLWNGGSGQAMVSRYRLFKERYGPQWEVTMEVGPPFVA